MTVEHLDENHPVGGVAEGLAHGVERALTEALTAMKAGGDDQTPHHLYVALLTAASAINIAAKLMSMPAEKEEVEKWAAGGSNRSSVLAAALLLARCVIPNDTGFLVEYNPTNILAAMEAAEKITGHNNDAQFTPAMVSAARKQTAPMHFFDNSPSASVTPMDKYRIN